MGHVPHTGANVICPFPVRILLLGGTTEAAELAMMLQGRDDLTVISSLAGRVTAPHLPAGIVRIGGFGGVAGLEGYVKAEKIDVVVDATHPFATKISYNAELVCRSLSLRLIALQRPPWEMKEGDCWKIVSDMRAAALAADHEGNRVFLSIGRQELDVFCHCEKATFLVRAIDLPDNLPPHNDLILKRGPFVLEDEIEMLREHSINLVVSKNSGGEATYAKIEAARLLSIPVVMVARPQKNALTRVSSVAEVLRELGQIIKSRFDRLEV